MIKNHERAQLNLARPQWGSLVLSAGLPFRLEGIYGEGAVLAARVPLRGAGEALPPRYPLKKGGFLGGPGGFPRAQLDYSTTSKEHVTKEFCEG
jgi:hypothetical protein